MNVLFTRNLSDFDLQLCATLGIVPDMKPLVASSARKLDLVLADYPDFWEKLDAVKAVAFTSQQAVDALFGEVESDFVRQLTSVLRRKPVYTVGESTADALDEYGIMARFPEDYNATTMARMMQNDGVHTAILHFCGDMRRPELEQAMLAAGVAVHAVVVYEKQEIDFRGYFSGEDDLRRYIAGLPAVAFYSPSAVHAFFRQGLGDGFSGEFFVIGSTTKAALDGYGVASQMPRVPTSELLIRLMHAQLPGGAV